MLTEKGPLEPRVVAEIGRQVADGLAAAHAAGVVHRDVKPGNVLIAEDGRVKLTDFGVSRAVDDVQLTRTGLIAGTPAFLSPEVARGQEPTAASDVFALGATLYAAVEGRPPFGLDDNAYALLHKVATGTVDPPLQAGPLTALVMRLLSDDPKGRPTASQARDALAPIAEGKPPASGQSTTGTAVLDVGAAATAAGDGTAAADPAPEQVATAAALPPTPPPPARPADPGSGGSTAPDRRRPLLIALAALLVVGLGVLVAVLTFGADTGSQSPSATTAAAPAPAAPPANTPGAAPTTTAAPTTSAEPTTSAPTTTETTTESAPVTDPVGFVQSFYGLLPGNTDAAWALLGPSAQSASGGRSGFDSFYAGIERVWAENLRVSGNTVTATIVFTPKDGPVTRESYTFVLGVQDGRQVIESFNR
jgi:hypothetical protein